MIIGIKVIPFGLLIWAVWHFFIYDWIIEREYQQESGKVISKKDGTISQLIKF